MKIYCWVSLAQKSLVSKNLPHKGYLLPLPQTIEYDEPQLEWIDPACFPDCIKTGISIGRFREAKTEGRALGWEKPV